MKITTQISLLVLVALCMHGAVDAKQSRIAGDVRTADDVRTSEYAPSRESSKHQKKQKVHKHKQHQN